MSSWWLPSSSCTSQAGTQTSLLFVASVVVVNDCIGAGCCCSVWTLLCERDSTTRGAPSKGAMCHGLTRLASNHWSIRCQIFPVAPSGIHVAQAPSPTTTTTPPRPPPSVARTGVLSPSTAWAVLWTDLTVCSAHVFPDGLVGHRCPLQVYRWGAVVATHKKETRNIEGPSHTYTRAHTRTFVGQ